MKSADSLCLLAKKVMRGAVGVGLDEAGTRLCGPTAWQYVKAVLSPVVAELEQRFPQLFLVPEDTEKAAEALSTDKMLQEMLHEAFAHLGSGQREILAVLAQQNDTLMTIGKSVDEGFARITQQMHAATAYLAAQLRQMDIQVETLIVSQDIGMLPSAFGLSPRQISEQAFTYQSDAQRWVEAGEAATACERLADARALVAAGLQRHPESAELLVMLGFIEKTQAQAAQLQADHDRYVESLAKAAKCFASVLSRDPTHLSGLNGMANVYLLHRDYDRAIALGTLAVNSGPRYGPAFWDLAISLECKLEETSPNLLLVKQLTTIYRRLETLMPQQPAVFTAANLAHVQKRLQALEHL